VQGPPQKNSSIFLAYALVVNKNGITYLQYLLFQINLHYFIHIYFLIADEMR
jgi:hypothetical protein